MNLPVTQTNESAICLNSIFRCIFAEYCSLVVAGISESRLHRYSCLIYLDKCFFVKLIFVAAQLFMRTKPFCRKVRQM